MSTVNIFNNVNVKYDISLRYDEIKNNYMSILLALMFTDKISISKINNNEIKLNFHTYSAQLMRVFITIMKNDFKLSGRVKLNKKQIKYLWESDAVCIYDEQFIKLKWLEYNKHEIFNLVKNEISKNNQKFFNNFLKIVFLINGYLYDPQKCYKINFRFSKKNQANYFGRLLKLSNIKSSSYNIGSHYVIAITNFYGLNWFLVFMNLQNYAKDLNNIACSKKICADVNRSVNMEIANYKRAIEAAYTQINMINAVIRNYDFNKLDDDVKYFIKLRVSHPSDSIKQLSKLSEGKLSISKIRRCINRLNKLINEL